MKKIFKIIKDLMLLDKYYVSEKKEEKRFKLMMTGGIDYSFIKYCCHINSCEDRCYSRIYKLLFTWKKQ